MVISRIIALVYDPVKPCSQVNIYLDDFQLSKTVCLAIFHILCYLWCLYSSDFVISESVSLIRLFFIEPITSKRLLLRQAMRELTVYCSIVHQPSEVVHFTGV